jgi:hypothetical protein
LPSFHSAPNAMLSVDRHSCSHCIESRCQNASGSIGHLVAGENTCGISEKGHTDWEIDQLFLELVRFHDSFASYDSIPVDALRVCPAEAPLSPPRLARAN